MVNENGVEEGLESGDTCISTTCSRGRTVKLLEIRNPRIGRSVVASQNSFFFRFFPMSVQLFLVFFRKSFLFY